MHMPTPQTLVEDLYYDKMESKQGILARVFTEQTPVWLDDIHPAG